MSKTHLNIRTLCIDVGTSSIKAGLIDEKGVQLWFAHKAILAEASMVETWSADIWEKALSEIGRDLSKTGHKPDAVVLSGNGPTLVPLGADGKPSWHTLLWLDKKRLALPGTTSFYLPKIAWFKANQPEDFSKTTQFLSCPEYLNLLLTGEAWTVTPSEEFIPFIWSPDEIGRYKIDADMLPPYVYPGHLAGSVTKEAAERFGLPEATPVYAGGSDFLMSLVGTGTLRPGLTCDRAGSSEGINHCSERQVADPFLRTLPHISHGLWNVAGILSSTGLMFEWFRGISGQRAKSYAEMIGEIRTLPVSGAYPHFLPNHQKDGNWEFAQGAFVNLKPEHHAAHMGRAVVEAIGYAVRGAVELLENAVCRVSELRVCGGQAKNEAWNHMKADITGKVLAIPEVPDAELMGNAIMAAVGMGIYRDMHEAAGAMVRFSRKIEPDLAAHQAFTERYELHRDMQSQIRKGLFPALGR